MSFVSNEVNVNAVSEGLAVVLNVRIGIADDGRANADMHNLTHVSRANYCLQFQTISELWSWAGLCVQTNTINWPLCQFVVRPEEGGKLVQAVMNATLARSMPRQEKKSLAINRLTPRGLELDLRTSNGERAVIRMGVRQQRNTTVVVMLQYENRETELQLSLSSFEARMNTWLFNRWIAWESVHGNTIHPTVSFGPLDAESVKQLRTASLLLINMMKANDAVPTTESVLQKLEETVVPRERAERERQEQQSIGERLVEHSRGMRNEDLARAIDAEIGKVAVSLTAAHASQQNEWSVMYQNMERRTLDAEKQIREHSKEIELWRAYAEYLLRYSTAPADGSQIMDITAYRESVKNG